MIMYEWADRWGIPHAAITELLATIGVHWDAPNNAKTPEGEVQQRVRLEASAKGCVLWRNNVGVTENHVRYGLCNDSPKVNKRLKSADLVGIRPVIVTPEMVGRKVGIFLAREAKGGDWVYRGTAREEAQLRWAMIVLGMGGEAAFTNAEGSI